MENNTADLRIAVLGNVDSGKSTLVGVLTKFCFDDGRGSARAHVLHHKHEKERGQSSSVAVELMGYDSNGNAVVPSKHQQHQQQQQHTKQLREVASKSTKLVSIIDLCGHEHFLKTTVFGLMGMAPDLVLLVVGANAGVQKMTREHLGLAAALQLPVVVVVTKIDMAPTQILEDSLKRVDRVLRLANRKKFQVKSEEDAVAAAQAMSSGNVSPVFQLSCINGDGVDLLRRFLQELACGANDLAGQGIRNTSCAVETEAKEEQETDCEIQVDNTFNVPGVGTVLSGSVFHGQVNVGSRLLLGPDNLGQFREVRIQSIHRQCVSVDKCFVGQQCTVAIKFAVRTQALPRNKIRKGMVLLSPERMERLQNDGGVVAVHSFEARVRILHHTTTIQEGYMPILHLGTVRQSAQIEKITFDNDDDGNEEGDRALRTGGEAVVRFRFAYHPEFVTVGRALVFREGTTKGVGKVIRLID